MPDSDFKVAATVNTWWFKLIVIPTIMLIIASIVNYFCPKIWEFICHIIKTIILRFTNRLFSTRFKIFISSASQDEELTRNFINLLTSSLEISSKTIFNSCKPDNHIRAGDDYAKKILDILKNSDYVIFIITSDFFSRHSCLIEMGAALALGKRKICISVPPIQTNNIHKKIPHIAREYQEYRIDNEDSLNNIADILKHPHDSNPWNHNVHEFINKLQFSSAEIRSGKERKLSKRISPSKVNKPRDSKRCNKI